MRRQSGLPWVVKCPVCGKDKWAYMGNDLEREPPCGVCCRAAAFSSQEDSDA